LAWTELIEKRGPTSRTYADGDKRSFHTVLGTRLHYEAALDSGVLDAEIDATPVRVDTAAFDGWRVETMGWHYALGRDLLNHGNEDGWVGFGGRKGQNWFKYRLNRVGYIHGPTREWQDIGGLATYDRTNLSQSTSTLTIGPNEDVIVVQSTDTWTGLWATPGGGSIDISWRKEGRKLKEEITVNQAAREWIAANRPPTTPIAETWFSFLFRLDWSDVPRIVRAGILQSEDSDFADDGERIELRDALDRVLALMPLDTVSVPGAEDNAPIRKRFYSDGGNHFLVIGVRCDALVGLPAGDLVFDPTFTDGYGGDATTAKDTHILNLGGNEVNNFGVRTQLSVIRNNSKSLLLFDLSSISGDATCDSATLYLYHGAPNDAEAWDSYVWSIASGNAGWPEGDKDGTLGGAGDCCWNYYDQESGNETSWAGSAGLSTADTDYETPSIGAFSGDASDAEGTEYVASLTAARVEGWFGAPNTNYGIMLWCNDAVDRVRTLCSSDHATTGYRPKLVVEYTAAGGATVAQIASVAWASVEQIAGVAEASIAEIAGVVAN